MSISPQSAVNAGAKWSIDGGATWHESGVTLTNVQITTIHGNFQERYQLELATTAGQTVTIAKGQTVVLTSTENVYTRQTGSLTVNFVDPAGASGASTAARIGMPAEPRQSTAAYYTVTFKSVNGWATPAPQKNVQVKDNVNKTVTGTYAQQHGSPKVIISPSAAAYVGATRGIDGNTWDRRRDHGAKHPLGKYSLIFKSVTGWTAPETENVTISKNVTSPAKGAYVAVK